MNPKDEKLNEILKAAQVPDRSPEYWEHFPKQITAHLEQGRGSSSHLSSFILHPSSLTSLFFPIAACLLIGFGIGFWAAHRPAPQTANEANLRARNEKLFKEVAAMFPHQVRAIISDSQGVHLVLADKAEVPNSPPLLLKICEGRQCRHIITFSGQQIQLDGETCDVLADSNGKVMLVGKHLYWSSAEPVKSTTNYRIRSETLETTL